MKSIYLGLTLTASLWSCSTPDSQNDSEQSPTNVSSNNDSITITPKDSAETITTDTTLINPKTVTYVEEYLNVDVENWSDKDFIVAPKHHSNLELIGYIEYLRSHYKNIPNPVEANYDGNDIGDYFHILFSISDTSYCDFGDGNNNLTEIQLYDPETLDEDPKYFNKKFIIHWAWKKSNFYCCSGEYENVEAYVPSIVKLELVE